MVQQQIGENVENPLRYFTVDFRFLEPPLKKKKLKKFLDNKTKKKKLV